MFELKPLSKKAIPHALEKAVHYRLLNEPWQTESICQDILETDPNHQEATYILIMAITDQFSTTIKSRVGRNEALRMADGLKDEYLRNYSKGLIFERQAIAALKRSTPRVGYIAYEFLRAAMDWYTRAEKIRPADNEESILRWNACVRIIQQHRLEAAPDDRNIQPFLDV